MERLRCCEVEDLHQRRAVAAARDHQRGRPEIAVHDTKRVPFGDAFTSLNDVVDHFRQVRAAQVLAHHVRSARIETADVGDARHVLAADLDRGARLADEALYELGVGTRVRDQELEGHLLTELEVSDLNHDAETGAARDALDPVLSGEYLAFAHDGVDAPFSTNQRRAMGIVENELFVVHELCIVRFGHESTVSCKQLLAVGAGAEDSRPSPAQPVTTPYLHRDYPVIQAMILLTSGIYVAINLLIDVAYTLLDPRIRY